MGILPWTFAQLRHEHARMFEALAEHGGRLLRLPEDAGGINDRSLAMCIWVRPKLGAYGLVCFLRCLCLHAAHLLRCLCSHC